MQSNGQTQCVCMSRCKKKRNLVCGSDGIFYDNHCELHRTACHFGEKISVDLDMKCFKAQERIHDCQDDKLSKMKKLILAMFDKEQRKKATTTRLIDELYFRYNKDGDHRVSSFELKKLISDYVMYPNIKELAEVCHATQWVKAEDDDKNGYLSKDEFSQSFGEGN